MLDQKLYNKDNLEKYYHALLHDSFKALIANFKCYGEKYSQAKGPACFNSNSLTYSFCLWFYFDIHIYVNKDNLFTNTQKNKKISLTTYRLSRRLRDNTRSCWRLQLLFIVNDFLSIFKNGTTACALITIYVSIH